jgi:methionyl-tRNA formyltransferase
MNSVILLMPPSIHQKFLDEMQALSINNLEFHFANSFNELEELFNNLEKVTLLFSFGTSVIVPEKYLTINGCKAVNIHSASPEFPGRDPHHFAVYESVKSYGATMHYMTNKVDDGAIIDIELFDINKEYSPKKLLLAANECSWKLVRKLFKWICSDSILPTSDLIWTGPKRTRKDFQRFCKIEPDIECEELERRIKAFSAEGYHNLYTEIQGRKFFLLKNE